MLVKYRPIRVVQLSTLLFLQLLLHRRRFQLIQDSHSSFCGFPCCRYFLMLLLRFAFVADKIELELNRPCIAFFSKTCNFVFSEFRDPIAPGRYLTRSHQTVEWSQKSDAKVEPPEWGKLFPPPLSLTFHSQRWRARTALKKRRRKQLEPN